MRKFVGNGMRKLCERAIGPAEAHLLDAVFAQARNYYAAHPADHAFVYDGMREVVEALRAEGWKTAILSNKPDYLVQDIADKLDLRDLFDAIAGERHDVPLKPDPRALLAMGRNLGAERIVMIGDGEPDGMVARNAGTGFVGVEWGIGTFEELSRFRSPVVDEPAELVEAIYSVSEPYDPDDDDFVIAERISPRSPIDGLTQAFQGSASEFQKFLDENHAPMANNIRQYLRGCPVFVGAPSLLFDPLSGEAIGGVNIHTDGVWSWSSILIYCYETYGLKLEPEFLEHVKRVHYRPPKMSHEEVKRVFMGDQASG